MTVAESLAGAPRNDSCEMLLSGLGMTVSECRWRNDSCVRLLARLGITANAGEGFSLPHAKIDTFLFFPLFEKGGLRGIFCQKEPDFG
ncbi:MAG: hypothetical protein U5L07_11325 [Desulfobacterales bacterium]|nr:hypothetical protein [Desulfobacterales bacterium]